MQLLSFLSRTERDLVVSHREKKNKPRNEFIFRIISTRPEMYVPAILSRRTIRFHYFWSNKNCISDIKISNYIMTPFTSFYVYLLLYSHYGIYILSGAIIVRIDITNANPCNNASRATLKLLIIWRQAYRDLLFVISSFPIALCMH